MIYREREAFPTLVRALAISTLVVLALASGCLGGPFGSDVRSAASDLAEIDAPDAVEFRLVTDGVGRSALLRAPADARFQLVLGGLEDGRGPACAAVVRPDGARPFLDGAFAVRHAKVADWIADARLVTVQPVDGLVRVAWACEPGADLRLVVGKGGAEVALDGTPDANVRAVAFPDGQAAVVAAEPLARRERFAWEVPIADVPSVAIVVGAEHTPNAAYAGAQTAERFGIEDDASHAREADRPSAMFGYAQSGWVGSARLTGPTPVTPSAVAVWEFEHATVGLHAAERALLVVAFPL